MLKDGVIFKEKREWLKKEELVNKLKAVISVIRREEPLDDYQKRAIGDIINEVIYDIEGLYLENTEGGLKSEDIEKELKSKDVKEKEELELGDIREKLKSVDIKEEELRLTKLGLVVNQIPDLSYEIQRLKDYKIEVKSETDSLSDIWKK